MFGVAGVAFVVGLVPVFFCVGERLALCEEGYWMGDLLRGSADAAWLVLSLSLVVGALLYVVGGSGQKEKEEKTAGAGEDWQGQQDRWGSTAGELVVSAAGEVEPIALDTSLEFGAASVEEEEVEENPDSVMAFVQDTVARAQVAPMQEVEERTVDGFYCPPGLENSHILYVDRRVSGEGDIWEGMERPGDPERAFGSLERAVEFARTLVLETDGQVQIRILPGIYLCPLQIPDRVVLINHCMPAHRTGEEYAEWLASQQEEVEHPERVTLQARVDSELAILFLPGRMQGVFGCFVQARAGVSQSGIRAVGCQALRVSYCVIEGFSGRGMELKACGGALAGAPVDVIGSVFRGNSSKECGGALYVQDSALRLKGCIFESNFSALGGAVFAKDLKEPLVLQDCRLLRNRALSRGVPVESVRDIALDAWQEMSGLGGAIAVQNSRLKVVDSRFDVNDAVLGGGAIAALGSRVVIACELGQTFVQNRAKIGGGVLAVGFPGEKSVVKSRGAVFQSCKAQQLGGGLALVGLSSAQVEGGHFYANHCADSQGAGGAVMVWKGAMLAAVDVRFSNNLSEGDGGAVAAINASLRMSEQCTVKANEAAGRGGGVYCVTAADEEMARLAKIDPAFAGPFALQLKELRVCANQSGGAGSGLLAGNWDGEAGFSLKIEMLESVLIYENHSAGDSRQTSVQWAGEERFGASTELPLRELLG